MTVYELVAELNELIASGLGNKLVTVITMDDEAIGSVYSVQQNDEEDHGNVTLSID